MPEQNHNPNDPANKLTDFLGFDPAKNFRITSEAFAEVVKEINKERLDGAKVRAKELLTKAIDLRTQMAKAKREFESSTKKFEKELGKVINSIQSSLDGRPDPKPEGGADDAEKVEG